ncbi:MAG: DNA methyltransferase, partial [Planctomyces sp.]
MLKSGQDWAIHHGDCIPHMLEDMPENSVDMAVFSPPFPSLYAYTASEADVGNVDAMGGEAAVHLSFMFNGLARVLKPGRVAVVHVCQIPRFKRTGGVGLCDFRGINIRLGERAGLVYEYDWMVRKNPQAQAIRTRSRELQFAGLESDRAKQRGTLQDYLIKFRKPGENETPIDTAGEVSRNDWIQWAEGCWDDIQETDTLNTAAAKSEDDTKHICPLQLEVIRRCVLLFSNPGEIVFSPFTGIGSEGF